MYQGLLGTFPFTVTAAEVCTFQDLKFSREQVYAEHKVVSDLPRLQHCLFFLSATVGAAISRPPRDTPFNFAEYPAYLCAACQLALFAYE